MNSKVRFIVGLALLLSVISVISYLIYDELSDKKTDTSSAMAGFESSKTEYYMAPNRVNAIILTMEESPAEVIIPVLPGEGMGLLNMPTTEAFTETEVVETEIATEIEETTEAVTETEICEEQTEESFETDITPEQENEPVVDIIETEPIAEEEASETLDEILEWVEQDYPDPYSHVFVTNNDVLKDYLNVRDVPGGNVIAILYPGSGGYVLETENGWSKIISGNVVGYVDNNYIIVGMSAYHLAPFSLRAVVCVNEAVLRTAPDEKAQMMDIITAGTRLSVLGYDSGWVYVVDADMFGYVPADEVYFSLDTGYAVPMSDDLFDELSGTTAAPETEVVIETEPVIEEIIPVETVPVETVPEVVIVPETIPEIDIPVETVPEVVPVPETVPVTEAVVVPETTPEVTVPPVAEYELTEDEKIAKRIDEYVNSGLSNRTPIYVSAADIYLMASVITLEDGYGSFAGQLAIANVIVTRVKSSYWDGTVEGVIYAPGQFYPRESAVLQAQMAKGPFDSAVEAAIQACAGINNAADYMYFITQKKAKLDTYTGYTMIDGCYFYKK